MENNQTQPALNVHSYESMGTYDGPGLRLVVFLQGCNFKCLYCANPDTIDSHGGKPTEAEEIVRMAVSQKAFFGRRGGITFSGGEPTFQAKALIPLCRRLKEEGIHICLDSNGGLWNDAVEELLSLVDLVLLDVKEFDNSRHRNPRDAATSRPCAPPHGSKRTPSPSGCAMCSCRATATRRGTSDSWESTSATTGCCKRWKSSPTTPWACTSMRPWDRNTG